MVDAEQSDCTRPAPLNRDFRCVEGATGGGRAPRLPCARLVGRGWRGKVYAIDDHGAVAMLRDRWPDADLGYPLTGAFALSTSMNSRIHAG